MKKTYIVANWKSNKTETEAMQWLQGVMNYEFKDTEVIVCPPFTLLSFVKSYLKDHQFPFKLGAQNISPFPQGAYTGEIAAEQVKEFASYVIIGHSERRKYFFETDEVLEKKVAMAKEFGLTPIFCVQDNTVPIPAGITLVAYEPLAAIGSGNPDTPENANSMAESIQKNHPVANVLYGGSVTAENVHSFTAQPHLSGVLVGGASLDPQKFGAIIQHA